MKSGSEVVRSSKLEGSNIFFSLYDLLTFLFNAVRLTLEATHSNLDSLTQGRSK